MGGTLFLVAIVVILAIGIITSRKSPKNDDSEQK